MDVWWVLLPLGFVLIPLSIHLATRRVYQGKFSRSGRNASIARLNVTEEKCPEQHSRPSPKVKSPTRALPVIPPSTPSDVNWNPSSEQSPWPTLCEGGRAAVEQR